MSGTLVQRFYEIAKLKAESPALGLEYDGAYHDLPWWFVKSKAKHFGMGLLEAGAQAGEYFYLLAPQDSAWIYAELGALTVGLRTLPLPPGISLNALATLFRRFPPAFVFTADLAKLEELLRGQKGLRRVVLAGDSEIHSPSLPADSFRRIFNSGIRCETKHHAAFRRLRESAEPSTELSPIRVDADGLVRESPLAYSEVNQVAARLTHALGTRPLRRLLAQADLTRTQSRIACLYWPLLSGAQAILVSGEKSFSGWIRRFHPEAIYPPPIFLQESEEALRSLPVLSPSAWSFGALRRRWELRRFRHRLHLASPALLLHEVGHANLTAAFSKLGLATLALE